MRKQKATADLARAAGDKVTEEKCGARISALKAKYNDLTEKCGLTPMRERMRTTEPLTNAGTGGIMNSSGVSGARNPFGVDKKADKQAPNKRSIEYKKFSVDDEPGYIKWRDEYYSKVNINAADKDSIKEYTDGSYSAINGAFRYAKGSKEYNKLCKQYGVNDLERYKKIGDGVSEAIGKFKLDDNIVVHRYVRDVDYIAGGSDVESIKNALGQEYVEKGFTSTCLFEGLTKHFGGQDPIHLLIKVPKNARGAYIDMFSEKKGLEYEFLLDKNTKFKVVDGGEREIVTTGWNRATRKFEKHKAIERFIELEVLE